MADPILWSETLRFLELLGRTPETVDALLFPPKTGPGSDKGAQKLKLDEEGRQSAERLLSMPLYKFHSLGVRPNPGGSKAAEITEGRALFFETDGGLSIEAQEALPELLGLPEPTVTVWTGGKSLHQYWAAPEGEGLSPAEWKQAQARLIAAVKEAAPDAGVDECIKDPSRVMRAPGGLHPSGGRASIHSEGGKLYSLAALVERLPAKKPQRGVTINRGLPRPEAPAGSLPKDQWQDLVIVRKLWAQSQLPFDRRMLRLIAADAPAMAEELGYGSSEEFLHSELDLDPTFVDRVIGQDEEVAKTRKALPSFPPATKEEILAALQHVPRRVAGSGTYATYRNLLWGMIAALKAANKASPEPCGGDWAVEYAIGAMDTHSPSEECGWDVEQVARSGGEEIGAGTFWHLVREHGYRGSASKDTSPRYTAGLSSLSSLSSLEQKSVRGVRGLSLDERMDLLREKATDLLKEDTALLNRLPAMREKASELDLQTRDGDLTKILWEARRRLAAPVEALGEGDLLDFTPIPWCWEGLIMREATNLVIAAPKVGKTSLVLAGIGAWSRGEAFLGRTFHGKCPPVLIVGTDQPQSDWGRMLQKVGLVSQERRMLAPLVGLFHSGTPLQLDQEGIEKITAYAKKHPGLLVLVDSYSRCISSLGLSERDAEMVGPLADLQEAVAPYGVTIVVIHHSNKGAHDSGSMASRGSTALPAAVSQILHLQRLEASQEQQSAAGKRMLTTEGRGGAPEKFLLELDQEGQWIFKGDGDALLREQDRQKLIGALNDRQAAALEHVEETWEQTEGKQGLSADCLASLMELRGADTSRVARRLLTQLHERGLVRKVMENHGMGRALVARYVPSSPPSADSQDSADSAAVKREEVSLLAEPPSMDSVDEHLPHTPPEMFDSVEVFQGGEWRNGWWVVEEGEELELVRSDDPEQTLRLDWSLVRRCAA